MPILKQSNGDGTFSTVTSSFPVSIPIGGADSYDMHIQISSQPGTGWNTFSSAVVSGSYDSLVRKIENDEPAKLLISFSIYYSETLYSSYRVEYVAYTNSGAIALMMLDPRWIPATLDIEIYNDRINVIRRELTTRS